MEDLTNGTVARNKTEIEALIGEINTATKALREGDRTNLSFQSITSLIYITWENMRPSPSSFNNVSIVFLAGRMLQLN